ncbi:uncharacterized protein [Amphiura filiformis]|uniref:uncharacterized protein n=1 Tax=Amphiura filiformis TaxID=82378 RepID=UPI003B210431
MDDITTATRGPGKCSKAGRLTLDFANIFKAFIGTNYLAAAFNFSQSGLVLGAIGMVIIATAAVHCCHLIVTCKKLAIRKILELQDSNNDAALNPTQLKLRKRIERRLTYGDIAWVAAGQMGLALVNFGLVVTQFGFCVGYYIFLGNTLSNFFPLVEETISFPSVTLSPSITHNSTVTPAVTSADNSHVSFSGTTTHSVTKNSSSFDPSLHHSGPASMYYIIVASLIPIFAIFALLRNIRQLGSSSLVANISVLVGYVAVLGFILSDFHVSDSIELYRWATFPIFFGGVTAGYEGIGTIIPIESSMEENRKYYPHLLYAATILFTFVLASLGILGYLHYGDDVQQIVIWNLPVDSVLSYLVNSVICIGILFTFPLQNFPVIDIFEELLFAQGRICGPASVEQVSTNDKKTFDESSPLLNTSGEIQEDKEMAEILEKLPVAAVIPDSVPAWKRNMLRCFIVILQAGVAVIFRNDFAYFMSFVGALGSTTLGYIVPCFTHIRLGGQRLGWPIITKDVAIILLGIVGGAASVYASVVAIINNASI